MKLLNSVKLAMENRTLRLENESLKKTLKDNPDGLTAKEISVEMKRRGYTPTDERNFSSPRITEMLISGSVECIGKKKCIYTNRNVGVFKLRVKQST